MNTRFIRPPDPADLAPAPAWAREHWRTLDGRGRREFLRQLGVSAAIRLGLDPIQAAMVATSTTRPDRWPQVLEAAREIEALAGAGA